MGEESCVYDLHDLPFIQAVEPLWEQGGWHGMNVTVPYKQAVIPYLDGLSEEAQKIGAVNTISFTPEGRIGHNTDALGFRRAIAPFLKGHHHRALVLGTGGSAAAVCHVLREIGLDVTRVSRDPKDPDTVNYAEIRPEGIMRTPVLINCTPVGMYPDVDAMPQMGNTLSGIGEGHLVMDLIYNPAETKFLSEASSLGARTLGGLSMLQHQADAAWEIWSGEAANR